MKKWFATVFALVCVLVLCIKTTSVFKTDNVSRITFYAYSGSGKGSDVPPEHMAEIADWLDSFTISHMALGLLPPGTNTVYVEIEYADGTVIKHGLDTAEIAGITFYTNSDEAPDSFQELLSKTSLSY
jgi:hypothetical protein